MVAAAESASPARSVEIRGACPFTPADPIAAAKTVARMAAEAYVGSAVRGSSVAMHDVFGFMFVDPIVTAGCAATMVAEVRVVGVVGAPASAAGAWLRPLWKAPNRFWRT